jgi:membrane protease YdiL (CAAX protease family)
MKHIQNSFYGKNAKWRYVVMIAAILIATNSIGAIPLLIGYGLKMFSNPEVIEKLAADPQNLSILGYSQNLTFFMMVFPFLAGIAAFYLLIKPLHQRTFLQTVTGSSSIRWDRFFVSAIIWTLFSAAYLFLYRGLDPPGFRLNNTSVTLLYLALLSLFLIPFQASFEEVLFRGYLMQGFSSIAGIEKTNPLRRLLAYIASRVLFPVIMTSLLFALMHSWNPEIKEYGFLTMMPQYLVFGLLFGIITVLDDGIEIAAGAHTANNFFLSIMITNSASTLQTPALFEQLEIHPWTEFWALLATSFLFFIIMRSFYRWNDMSVLVKRIVPGKTQDQTV